MFEQTQEFSSGASLYSGYQVITVSEEEPLLSWTLSSSKTKSYDDQDNSTFSSNYTNIPEKTQEALTEIPHLPLPAQAKQPEQKSELLGYLYLSLASVAFAANDLLVHVAEVNYGVSSMSCVFLVSLVLSGLSFTYLASFTPFARMVSQFDKNQVKLIVCRGIVGAATSTCLYASFSYLPTGDATAIFFVGPAFTIFFSSLFLGEKVTPLDVVTAAFSITGAVLVSSPGSGGASGSDMLSSEGRLFGCFCALMAALLSAMVYVLIRSVVASVHYMVPILSLGVCETVMSVVLGGGMTPWQMMENWDGVSLVIISGVFSFVAQSFMQMGLKHSQAGTGSLVRNLEVPVVYILGVLLLHELPTAMKIMGSILVVSSAFVIGLRQMLRTA